MEDYYPILAAFIISIMTGPGVIYYLRKHKLGQQVRQDGPYRHLQKSGTPTMGGVIFLLALAFSSILFLPRTLNVILLVVLTLGHGAIGFADDYQKLVRRRSLGLKARAKLLGQVSLVFLLALVLWQAGHSTEIFLPWSPRALELGFFYPLLLFLVIIGTSNAVNLTDGLDGLAAGTAVVSFLAYFFIARSLGMEDIALFCGVMTGACFGFLIFNLHPARIFMGDVGSLSLGAALGTVAVLTKTEALLVIIGGVFVIETLSVILQVLSYQSTGKRIFKMSPLHHHFELSNWSEWKVVTVFWGVSFFLALVGLTAV